MTTQTNSRSLIAADICSRPNAMNGRYRVMGLRLEDVPDADLSALVNLRDKADVADRAIAQAEAHGKDICDPDVLRNLGIDLGVAASELDLGNITGTVIGISLQLMVAYGLSIAIWSLPLNGSFLEFGFGGAVVGLIFGLLLVRRLIFRQRTKQEVASMTRVTTTALGMPTILIGVLGLIVWAVKSL